MLPAEASWLGRVLSETSETELSPILNLGSSTSEFRAVTKPHIDFEIFTPLARRQIKVIHADLKEDEGVDIAGNILDPAVQEILRGLGVRSVMCNNMLEHVTDIDQVCAALSQICPPGGLLFMTVPHDFPYHPDPIDNGFRPTINDLVTLLSRWGFDLRVGEIISCGSYVQKVRKKPSLLARDVYLLGVGVARPGKVRMLRENYRFWTKEYRVACGVFIRRGE